MDTVAELIRCGFDVEQNNGWVCVRSADPFLFTVKEPACTAGAGQSDPREAVLGPRGYQALALHDNGKLQIAVEPRVARRDLAARIMAGHLAQSIVTIGRLDRGAARCNARAQFLSLSKGNP